MTIATPRSTEGSADRAQTAVVWTSIQAGLWVANVGGEFAGMIERSTSGEFFITDRLARPLGSCASLEEAKARHQRQRHVSAPPSQPTI